MTKAEKAEALREAARNIKNLNVLGLLGTDTDKAMSLARDLQIGADHFQPPLEKGAAGLVVKHVGGKLTVRHESDGDLLLTVPAIPPGTWAKLIDLLTGLEGAHGRMLNAGLATDCDRRKGVDTKWD